MSVLCLVALKRRLWLLPILTAGWLCPDMTEILLTVSLSQTDYVFQGRRGTSEAPRRDVSAMSGGVKETSLVVTHLDGGLAVLVVLDIVSETLIPSEFQKRKIEFCPILNVVSTRHDQHVHV